MKHYRSYVGNLANYEKKAWEKSRLQQLLKLRTITVTLTN